MARVGRLSIGERYKKTFGEKSKFEKTKSSNKTFNNVLESEILTKNAIKGIDSFDESLDVEEILDAVHECGEELVKDANYKTIENYKKAVKNFISYVVTKALEVESIEGARFNSFKPESKQKRYTLISIIDDKLDKLASGILLNQSKQLDILSKVEEINGLIVNLLS